MPILADQIRSYVTQNYIEPARAIGKQTLQISAVEIHRDMGLSNRVPAVCGALDARKLYAETDITLLRREGPRQGYSAQWTFGI